MGADRDLVCSQLARNEAATYRRPGIEMATSAPTERFGSRAAGMSIGRMIRRLGIAVLALCQFSTLAMAMSVADRATGAPALRSHIGSFRWLDPVQPAPATSLRALDGTAVDLTQFQGRVVLVHFWATWCVLCVFKLPDLDRLAVRRASDRFAVIAVSMDQDGAQTVAPFVARNNLKHLPIYLDPGQVFASAFPPYGIPVSYIIDRRGNIVGFVEGAVDWNSFQAQRFIDYFLAAP